MDRPPSSPIADDAETRVALALSMAYVRESGLLEDDPIRYVNAHRPHARAAIAAIAAYERHRRDATDDSYTPDMLRWCEWPDCLASYHAATGPPPGDRWIYVRTGAHVLLCPAHQNTGHRPQRPQWQTGATSMDVSCECGATAAGLTPTTQRRMIDWWAEHITALTNEGGHEHPHATQAARGRRSATNTTSDTLPDWMRPPRHRGWRTDDLDQLPATAPSYTELVDGALVFTLHPEPPQHARITSRLAAAFDQQAPTDVLVRQHVAVHIGRYTRLIPDVALIHSQPQPHPWYTPENIVLVVEVVSPETAYRDTTVKFHKYAEAGIRHYWLIDNENNQPVLRVYELDTPTMTYLPTTITGTRLTARVPFAFALDIADLLHDNDTARETSTQKMCPAHTEEKLTDATGPMKPRGRQ